MSEVLNRFIKIYQELVNPLNFGVIPTQSGQLACSHFRFLLPYILYMNHLQYGSATEQMSLKMSNFRWFLALEEIYATVSIVSITVSSIRQFFWFYYYSSVILPFHCQDSSIATPSTLCLKKFPPLNSLYLCQILTDCQIFAALESIWNLLQNTYDTTHLTLGMLPDYLGKLKIQIFCRRSADV